MWTPRSRTPGMRWPSANPSCFLRPIRRRAHESKLRDSALNRWTFRNCKKRNPDLLAPVCFSTPPAKRMRPRRSSKWPRNYQLLFAALIGDLFHAARQEDWRAAVGLQDYADNAKMQRCRAGQIVDARQSAQESGERGDLHRHRPLDQHTRQAIRVKLKR